MTCLIEYRLDQRFGAIVGRLRMTAPERRPDSVTVPAIGLPPNRRSPRKWTTSVADKKFGIVGDFDGALSRAVVVNIDDIDCVIPGPGAGNVQLPRSSADASVITTFLRHRASFTF